MIVWQIYTYSVTGGVQWWFVCVYDYVSLYEVAIEYDRKVILLLDSYATNSLLHVIDFDCVPSLSRWLWHSILAVVVSVLGNLKVAVWLKKKKIQDEIIEGYIMSLKARLHALIRGWEVKLENGQ